MYLIINSRNLYDAYKHDIFKNILIIVSTNNYIIQFEWFYCFHKNNSSAATLI